MTYIFSTNERKVYRDLLSRLIMVLEMINDKPLTNWRIACRLETAPVSMERILSLGIEKGLITTDGKYYKITQKGRQFLEVLKQ